MKKAEKTLHSFMVAEPTTGGPGYTVTLKPGANVSLFNLMDSEATGSIREHLFKLAIHLASIQTALFDATEDAFAEKANLRIDPVMPEVYWTLEELYAFFEGLDIEFTEGGFDERSA